MIFETHAHYDDAAFDEDRQQLWLSKWWGIVAAMVFILAVVLLCSMLRDLHEAFSFVGHHHLPRAR